MISLLNRYKKIIAFALLVAMTPAPVQAWDFVNMLTSLWSVTKKNTLGIIAGGIAGSIALYVMHKKHKAHIAQLLALHKKTEDTLKEREALLKEREALLKEREESWEKSFNDNETEFSKLCEKNTALSNQLTNKNQHIAKLNKKIAILEQDIRILQEKRTSQYRPWLIMQWINR